MIPNNIVQSVAQSNRLIRRSLWRGVGWLTPAGRVGKAPGPMDFIATHRGTKGTIEVDQIVRGKTLGKLGHSVKSGLWWGETESGPFHSETLLVFYQGDFSEDDLRKIRSALG